MRESHASDAPRALPYELPPAGPGGLVVEVRPDGVLLRLPARSAAKEIGSHVVSLLGQLAMVGCSFATLWTGMNGVVTTPPVLFWATVAVIIFFLTAALLERLKIVKAVLSRLRPSATANTQFIFAADQAPARNVDPVRWVQLRRQALQVNLTRPYVLEVVTAGGKTFSFLRGHPRDELIRLIEELSSLLRLDAAQTNAFPVVNVREGGQ